MSEPLEKAALPGPDNLGRVPDLASEARLIEIRREAEQNGRVDAPGVHAANGPMPHASVENGYYGIPLLKEPQWKWEVPLYFFAGGAAGAAAIISTMANWTGADRRMVRDARWVAAAGGLISPALLIADLGRPSRFLNMLRVFKLQSPMSVGAWTLFAFSNVAVASAFAAWIDEKLGGFFPVRVLGNAAETLAGATGLVMASYTGVLIGATAVPVWNKNVETLPVHFAASGLNSAVSVLELMGHSDSRALNLLGMMAATLETLEGAKIEMDADEVHDPLRHGGSGWLTRAGGLLSGPLPLALRLASLVGGRRMRRGAAWASIAGSLITRYAWMRAGRNSARDYKLPLELSPQKLEKGRRGPAISPVEDQEQIERAV